jgi:hypothetical protein
MVKLKEPQRNLRLFSYICVPKAITMDEILNWAKNLNCAITVSDVNGIIIYMNDKSGKTFEKWGGLALIGKSMYNCHSPKSQETIKRLMNNGETNVYTIEKAGVKKMIYQTPWYKDGKVAGMVELSLEIPFELPHFVRG